MIAFWVVAGVLSAAAAGLVLWRAARAVAPVDVRDPSLGLYRRQLDEIDDLADRGLLGEAERASAHAEAARRLLAADSATQASWTDGGRARGAIVAVAALAPLLAMGVYFAVGAPGTPDQPFSKRLDAWRSSSPASLAPAQMAAVLKAVARERPRDPDVYRFLALAETAAGNPSNAARALRHAIELAPNRVDLWEALGEALLVESNGQVTPEAQTAFREVLKRDPRSPTARFHLARGRVEAGETVQGIAEWRALLADLPADDPRRDFLKTAIAEAEKPPAPAAPFAGGQLDMIRGMVAGLAARLEQSPDDAEGWVRLVRSYAVLGDATARDAALAKARERFSGRPDVLADLQAAAKTPPMAAPMAAQDAPASETSR